GAIAAVNAVLTPLRASADASFMLNQGMGELVITPQRAPKAIVEGVKVIHSASGNPHAYYSLLEDAASRGNALLREAGIEQDAVEWFTQRGAHYAGAGGPDDFQFPQKFEEALRRIPGVGKVPAEVVRWSNETFARYLNLKRVNLNNDALERLVKQGLRGEELDKAMRAAIRANNRATGWTGTKAAGWQELALFAPRYFKSNIEQVVNAVSKGGMEGSIARRHLLGLLGYATVITYAINAARGYNTSVDPRDHNFLRIRNVGGHDISVLGPFASLIRAGAQAVGGRADMTDIEQRGRGLVWGRNAPKPEPFEAAKSFARAKASPVFST